MSSSSTTLIIISIENCWSGQPQLDIEEPQLQADGTQATLDIVTPGDMNGRELARWALQKCHGLKVLLTTGFISDEVTAELPVKDGCFDLLRKPYTREELAAAVRAVLDGA